MADTLRKNLHKKNTRLYIYIKLYVGQYIILYFAKHPGACFTVRYKDNPRLEHSLLHEKPTLKEAANR